MIAKSRLSVWIGLIAISIFGTCVCAQQADPYPQSQSDLSGVVEVGSERLNGGSSSLAVDSETTSSPDFFETFNLPPQGKDYRPTRALRCDVVRHLKTPSTYRRLDSYMKPQAILPEAKDSDVMGRDYATGQWGGLRRDLYKKGIDIYGCFGFDHLGVVESNVSSDPNVKT